MKKILILGGEYSTVEVLKISKQLGYYVIVTSDSPTGEAKELSDEKWMINTSDIDSLVKKIKENEVSGVMTGASEFHLLNALEICHRAGLPFYATRKQWDTCQNKESFKELCRKEGVPCVKQFLSKESVTIEDYPVIIKPVDACSARGISVCSNSEELELAEAKALSYSPSKKTIIEKYIQNGGTTLSARYIAADGDLYLEAVGDRYVLNPDKGKALITAAAFYPSKHTDYYIRNVDEKVKSMFKSIGLKNGAFFLESLYTEEDGVMFYEMGLRVSGGMTYKITEVTNDVNELKMLVRYAMTGKMYENLEDLKKINPHLNGYATASISFPLKTGTISSICGFEKLSQISEVHSVTQYYCEGDTILPKYIGTLDQLLCRVSVIALGKHRLVEVAREIASVLSVLDEKGDEMILLSQLEDILKDYSE